MICCVHRTLAVALTALVLAVQSHAGEKSEAHVLIDLPSFVPSETVSINYFLYGPFGAYGGFVTQEPGLHSYDIKSSVDGKAASEIRLLVYARGCEIRTFEIHLNERETIKREFDCRPLPTTTLSGQIVPRQLVVGKAAQLRIMYMAAWSHEFFGIMDGPIVEIPLATATPDDTGMFETDIPDFDVDPATSAWNTKPSLHLLLRDAKTWNIIAVGLEPDIEEYRGNFGGLDIRSFYPSGLTFSDRNQQ
jgi:hypothetical protein